MCVSKILVIHTLEGWSHFFFVMVGNKGILEDWRGLILAHFPHSIQQQNSYSYSDRTMLTLLPPTVEKAAYAWPF